MKKILSAISMILCAALLCLPVSAASKDAYTLYQNAAEKLNNVTSVEMKMKLTMETSLVETPIKTTATVRMLHPSDPDKMEMEMQMAYDELGMKVAVYYKDGYFYQNIAGEKSKTKMDFKKAMEMSNSMDMDIEKDAVRDGTVEVVEGGKLVKFKMSGEQMSSMMDSTFSAMFAATELGDMKVTIGDMSYSMLIGDDGMIDSYKMNYDTSFASKELNMSAKYKTDVKIVSVNQFVRIAYPSDLDQYVRV